MDFEYTTIMPLKMPLNIMPISMPDETMLPPPLFGLRRSAKKLDNDEDEDENESFSSVEMFMNMSRRASPPPMDDSREDGEDIRRNGKRAFPKSKSKKMSFLGRRRRYASAA
jgi:hypothetical protein